MRRACQERRSKVKGAGSKVKEKMAALWEPAIVGAGLARERGHTRGSFACKASSHTGSKFFLHTNKKAGTKDAGFLRVRGQGLYLAPRSYLPAPILNPEAAATPAAAGHWPVQG